MIRMGIACEGEELGAGAFDAVGQLGGDVVGLFAGERDAVVVVRWFASSASMSSSSTRVPARHTSRVRTSRPRRRQVRHDQAGTKDKTSRPPSSMPSARGAHGTPAASRWRKTRCTSSVFGPAARRIVLPTRTRSAMETASPTWRLVTLSRPGSERLFWGARACRPASCRRWPQTSMVLGRSAGPSSVTITPAARWSKPGGQRVVLSATASVSVAPPRSTLERSAPLRSA